MAVAFLAAALLLLPMGAAASPSDPTQWPDQPGSDPELTATANAIRFAGADRYQTNQALGLALRGSGGFPFDTSDPTGASVSKVASKHWWGAASCPRSIIVVAGDTAADSLAAASLSDPTDRSEQPRLQRVAATDPVFDKPGDFDRVDTAFAPIVVTTSARSGATRLVASARATATDLANGGCTLAREAILVGGTDAVPSGVESELVGLGYDEVFRVAGTDRYDTAARVATALGTGTPPPAGTQCVDRVAADGRVEVGFYGNAAIEYRFDGQSCLVLGRAVVLADGLTGIDALAAGWWTSRWQVPVLLTGPGGSLPSATREALRSLPIDTLIILGSAGRIPETTETQAGVLATTKVVGRFGGDDRYATSVKMAQAFGGWFPSAGATFADDVLCVTASSGPSASPDALAAGPFCGRLGAARVASPARAVPPLEGAAARTLTAGGTPGGHGAVPVLLVPVGGSLPRSVAEFLGAAFAAKRCTGEAAPTGCADPGFAAVVGGSVSAQAVTELSGLLGGTTQGQGTPVADGFVTRLDLRPVFDTPSPSGLPVTCFGSAGLDGVRWLSLSTDATRRTFLGQHDVLRAGWYQDGESAPHCVALPAVPSITVSGVGAAGDVGAPTTFNLAPGTALSVTNPVEQDGTATASGTSTIWSFLDASAHPVSLRRSGLSREITSAVLGLDLDVRDRESPGVGVAAGQVTMTTSFGQIAGTIRADARLVGGVWELAGVVRLGPFAEGTLRGGFRATITGGVGQPPHIAWVIDAVPTT